MRNGTTLAELAAALALLATLAALALPAAARWSHWSALNGAREATVGLLAGARRYAVADGGASVTFRTAPWRARLEAGGVARAEVALEEAWGVSLDPDAAGATLVWDALGLGRFASRTLRFRRAGLSAELVVSSYGRVRRR